MTPALDGEIDFSFTKKWELGDLCIRTKDKRLVRFAPNEVQAQFLDLVLPTWRTGVITMRGLRHIILKARQFGFSTLIAALFFIDTISAPQTGSVVISYDQESSEKLFEMVDRMYRNLPKDQRPRTQRASRRELYWPDIDCHYDVMTAGKRSVGRSWTVNNLHISEYGFWEYPDVLGGLLQSVPDDGNVFIESTANGEGYELQERDGELVTHGNSYHVEYSKAKEERSEYGAHFFAWFQHPEYREVPDSSFRRIGEKDKSDPFLGKLFERYGDEERLAELYHLDDAQLNWRRKKIDSPKMGPAKFAQEYPANDVEAFRTSGKRFFAGLWDQDRHVRYMEIKPWWQPIGGFDWGYGVPYAGLLMWAFPMSNGKTGLYVSDELYGARVRNTDQRAAVIAVMRRRGIEDLRSMNWYADPAMWAKEGSHQADNIGRANVEDFWTHLSFVKANNNREHGCSNLREYLAEDAFIVSPDCENLIRQFGTVLADPHDLEVYEKSETAEQHAMDAARYGANSRPRKGEQPPQEPEQDLTHGLIATVTGDPAALKRALPFELSNDNQDDDGYWEG